MLSKFYVDSNISSLNENEHETHQYMKDKLYTPETHVVNKIAMRSIFM